MTSACPDRRADRAAMCTTTTTRSRATRSSPEAGDGTTAGRDTWCRGPLIGDGAGPTTTGSCLAAPAEVAEQLGRRGGRSVKVKPHSEPGHPSTRCSARLRRRWAAHPALDLYNSRGQYRSGRSHAPRARTPAGAAGFDPADEQSCGTEGDRTDRLRTGDGREGPGRRGKPVAGRLKLDDFVYEQDKTNAILERIERVIASLKAPGGIRKRRRRRAGRQR